MEDSEATGPQDPLALLLEVQARDLHLDQLADRRRQLGERRALEALEARAAELEERSAGVRTERDRLDARLSDLEAHADSYSSRIEAIERRLREGGAYREVQAMSGESESLARHRRQLEDEELEVMEQMEPLEEELGSLSGELAGLAGARREASAALAGAEAVLEGEAAEVAGERGRLAAGLPPDLLATYERLRQRLGGVGAARLADGACGGCHLKLPNSEREHVLHAAPGEVVFCDQCGRILVA